MIHPAHPVLEIRLTDRDIQSIRERLAAKRRPPKIELDKTEVGVIDLGEIEFEETP